MLVSCTVKKEFAFEEGGTSDLVLSSVVVLFGGEKWLVQFGDKFRRAPTLPYAAAAPTLRC